MTRLQDLLAHLYVLIPVLDNEKHYWVGEDEIQKLLNRGEGWLAQHPEKDLIVSRYLKRQRHLTREALERLSEDEPESDEPQETVRDEEEQKVERPLGLHEQRMGTVLSVLRGIGAKRIVDLGCGEGKLLRSLLADPQFESIFGMDVSWRSIEIAKERLKIDHLPERQRSRIRLIQGSLMYRDERISGFDAAAVVEVIEHLDAPRLSAFERVLFEFARPTTAIITTPNSEYNALFETLPAGQFRPRPPFEWTRGVRRMGRFNGLSIRISGEIPANWSGRRGARSANSNGDLFTAGECRMKIDIPELSLVLLIGPSGSGKSSFGRKHFLPTEVISSDFCRGLVADNENDQSATGDAFDLLHAILRKRLARGKLAVIDATNVQPEARKTLIELAREHHVFAIAIVFDLPERLCQDRNVSRPDRQFGPHVVRNQLQQLRKSLRGLEREGIRYVFKLSSVEEVDAATIERQPLWNNRKSEHGTIRYCRDGMAASMISNCSQNITPSKCREGQISLQPGSRSQAHLCWRLGRPRARDARGPSARISLVQGWPGFLRRQSRRKVGKGASRSRREATWLQIPCGNWRKSLQNSDRRWRSSLTVSSVTTFSTMESLL